MLRLACNGSLYGFRKLIVLMCVALCMMYFVGPAEKLFMAIDRYLLSHLLEQP